MPRDRPRAGRQPLPRGAPEVGALDHQRQHVPGEPFGTPRIVGRVGRTERAARQLGGERELDVREDPEPDDQLGADPLPHAGVGHDDEVEGERVVGDTGEALREDVEQRLRTAGDPQVERHAAGPLMLRRTLATGCDRPRCARSRRSSSAAQSSRAALAAT